MVMVWSFIVDEMRIRRGATAASIVFMCCSEVVVGYLTYLRIPDSSCGLSPERHRYPPGLVSIHKGATVVIERERERSTEASH